MKNELRRSNRIENLVKDKMNILRECKNLSIMSIGNRNGLPTKMQYVINPNK